MGHMSRFPRPWWDWHKVGHKMWDLIVHIMLKLTKKHFGQSCKCSTQQVILKSNPVHFATEIRRNYKPSPALSKFIDLLICSFHIYFLYLDDQLYF